MNISARTLVYAVALALSIVGANVNAAINHYEAALQAYNQHDIETAFIHLKNALQQNEQNLPAKLLLAKVLIEKHSYAAAEQELNDTIAQGVDINLIVDPLGQSILHQGKFEQALHFADKMSLKKAGLLAYALIKAKAYLGLENMPAAELGYNKVLANYPNNVDALLGLATVYIYQNNSQQAKPLLDKVSNLSPNNDKLWQLKGQIARITGQHQEAIRLLSKASQLAPDNIATLRILASSYVDVKNFVMANQVADKVLKIEPNDPQTKFLKASVLRDLDQTSLANKWLSELSDQLSNIDESYLLTQPQLLLLDAMTSYTQKNWKQAEVKFKKYVIQAGAQTEVNAIMLLADVYQQLKQPNNALLLLEKNEHKLLAHKDYALILAGLYLQFAQNFKADFLLSSLRKQYPTDEGVLILSAKVIADSGQIDKALSLLESAKIHGDNNYQYTLALLSLQAGDVNKSLNYISPLTTKFPDNIRYQLMHAQVLIALQQFKPAAQIINNLYAHHPQDRDVSYSYALLQFNLGQFETAKTVLTALLKQHNDDSQGALLLAKVEYKLGNKASAIAGLERQTKLEAVRREALGELVNIFINEKNWQSALSIANRMLSDNRLDISALFIKARTLLALNQQQDAKHQLDILVGLVENDVPKLMQLSQLQLQVSDLAGADFSLQKAYSVAPNSLPVIVQLIKLKLRLNNIKQANKLLMDAQQGPYQGSIFLTILQGDIFSAKHQTNDAFNQYMKAFKQDYSNVVALMKLSEVSQTPSLSDKFIAELTEVLLKHPELSLHRHLLADHLLEHHQYQKAKYQYQVLLTNNLPLMKRAMALNNLASIYIDDKNYSMAVETAQQALHIANNIPAIIDTTGWAFVLAGKLDQGLSYLRQAFSLSSTSPDIQYHIAYTLTQLKRKEEAKQMLLKIIESPDNFKEHKLAQQLLEQLNK